jgi:hypothetical protein
VVVGRIGRGSELDRGISKERTDHSVVVGSTNLPSSSSRPVVLFGVVSFKSRIMLLLVKKESMM